MVNDCRAATRSLEDFRCLSWAVWKEARGEGILTQRAVIDIISNRSKKSGKGFCTVLRQPYQFPYFVEGIGQTDKKWKIRMEILINMPSVLLPEHNFFNDGNRLSYGVHKHVKLGNLYFS